MLRTVVITGAISFAILSAILLLTVAVRPTLDTEYLEFALALAMFLVILVGSYWFVVRGPGRYMYKHSNGGEPEYKSGRGHRGIGFP